MRVFTFILLFFVLKLLRNSVHGSEDRLRRIQSTRDRQRRRPANPVLHQTGMITIEQIQQQFGQLGVNTAQSSSYQHGDEGTPLPRPILTQHGRTADSPSSSRSRRTSRQGSVQEMQMHALRLRGQNNDHEYNPRAPPPLPSEHFDNIYPGSLISVMIRGKKYIDVGILFEEDIWPYWVMRDYPIQPFGPDSAWISVPDSDIHRQPRRDHMLFAARFTIFLPHTFQAQDYTNPISEVFITSGEHVYHAPLSLHLPTLDNNPSVVSVLGEIRPDTYRCLHGALEVWDTTRYHVPEWVLRKKPIWL